MKVSSTPTDLIAILTVVEFPDGLDIKEDLLPYRLSLMINKGDGFQWVVSPEIRNTVALFLMDQAIIGEWVYIERDPA